MTHRTAILREGRLEYSIFVALVSLLLGSCAAPRLTEQPDFDHVEGFSFDIDARSISFGIPSGGDVGQHNTFSIDTTQVQGDFQILFSFGYDQLTTSTKWYNISNLLFGVTKTPECGFACFLKRPADQNRPTSNVRLIDLGGDTVVNESNLDGNGDFVEQYILKLNDRFSLFFTLRMYAEHSDYPGLVDSRRAMLREIVLSLRNAKP